MFKKHINHKKIIACALGVILGLAPVPSLLSAVTVHAEESAQNRNSFMQALNDALYDLNFTAGEILEDVDIYANTQARAMMEVLGAQNAFMQYLQWQKASEIESNMSGFSYYSGVYKVLGQGDTLYASNLYEFNRNDMIVARGAHFAINVRFFRATTGYEEFIFTSTSQNNRLGATLSPADGGVNYNWAARFTDENGFFTDYSRNNLGAAALSFGVAFNAASIPTLTEGTTITSGMTLSGGFALKSLPSGEMKYAEPWEYYNNTLLPELQDLNSPQYIAFPNGFDSDAVTLPTSPHIGLNAEKGNLSDLNLDLEPYSSGFDFWWWLTDSVLTDLHLRTVVLLLIALGSVGFIVWKVGR